MNVRQSITACVAVTTLGQLGGAACGGHLDATEASTISPSDASPIDVSVPRTASAA